MRMEITALGLAPLLIGQALYVRRVIPRLPEAAGPRAGLAGEGRPLSVILVGDSSAAGVGASAQSEALAGRLIEHLATRFQVRWRLVAQTGATTRDAIRWLRELPPARFDVAVTALGVNDVVRGVTSRGWIRSQAELVALLRNRFGVRHVLLSGLPPMHEFPALPQPLRWFLGARSQRFDGALAQWVGTQPGCEHVALDFAPDVRLVASDGFHPGPGAYELWGRELAARALAARMPPGTLPAAGRR